MPYGHLGNKVTSLLRPVFYVPAKCPYTNLITRKPHLCGHPTNMANPTRVILYNFTLFIQPLAQVMFIFLVLTLYIKLIEVSIGLIMVFDAILTGRQSSQKLQRNDSVCMGIQ